MIIGLSGYAQSGKDTTAQFLVDEGFERIAFADALRDALYALNPIITEWGGTERVQDVIDRNGWDESKVTYSEIRQLLQRLGTEVGRNQFGPTFWVDIAFKKLTDPNGKYVFTDCRFAQEAQAIKDAGGQIWRITRDGTAPVNAHPSETALDDWDFDGRLFNNSTLASLRIETFKCLAIATYDDD